MKIIELSEASHPSFWIDEMIRSGWSAGVHLAEAIREGRVSEKTGENPLILLIVNDDEDELMAFCTLAESDDVKNSGLAPWIGYVFTFEKFRGQKLAPTLIAEAEKRARDRGDKAVYISTGHEGLYERYGYHLKKKMANYHGVESRIYEKELN